MAVLDTAMGGVGTGVQPKDNPNPSTPMPSAAAQTAANSLPPGSAALSQGGAPAAAMGGGQNQQPAPQSPGMGTDSPGQATQPTQAESQTPSSSDQKDDKQDQDLDAILEQLSGKKKSKKAEKAVKTDNSELDSALSELTGGKASEPTKAIDFAQATEGWPDALKFTAAKMRSELGRDPKEQRQAFESMFGGENVKTMGNSLYFRPNAEAKFRKVDSEMFGKWTDMVLFKALPQLVPTAANAVTQGVVDARFGNPAAGGAAGGAADALTRQGMISAINQISNIPQDSEHVSLKKEVLLDAGLNAVAPVGIKYARQFPLVKQSLDKLYGAFHSAGEAALNVAGEGIEKAAAIRTAFREFKDTVLPGAAKSSEQVGHEVASAVDATHAILSKNVGLIETEAKALAKQKDMKVQFPQAMERLTKALGDYGYHLDQDTGLIKKLDDTGGSLMSSTVRNATEEMADFLNRLTRETYAGGSSLDDTFKYMGRLDKLSQFDKVNPLSPSNDAEVRNLYRQIRNAAGQDRNAAISQVYDGTGLPNEKLWKNAYDKYAQNIDAIGDFKAAFHSPQQKELLVGTLLKSSNPDKLEMLDGMKQVLGVDSPEWNSFRGSIYSELLGKFSKDGSLNAGRLVSWMNDSANKQYLKRVFSDEERGALNRMAIEAKELQKVDTNLGETLKSGIKKGLGAIMGMHDNPAEVVKDVLSVFGGNAKAINYLADEGFLEMAQQAQGPTIKRRILQSMDALDAARSKMKVIYPDKGVPIYVPVGGAVLGTAIQSKIHPFRPQYGAPTEAPAQPME